MTIARILQEIVALLHDCKPGTYTFFFESVILQFELAIQYYYIK